MRDVFKANHKIPLKSNKKEWVNYKQRGFEIQEKHLLFLLNKGVLSPKVNQKTTKNV